MKKNISQQALHGKTRVFFDPAKMPPSLGAATVISGPWNLFSLVMISDFLLWMDNIKNN